MSIGAKDLDHVVIAVGDLGSAIADFSRMFGLSKDRHIDSPAQGFIGDTLPVGDAYLELLTPNEPESEFAKLVAQSGEGMIALAIEVDSLDGAVEQLRSQDIKVTDPAASSTGSRIAYIGRAATHGVLIQLIER